jgi:hypothetical protein
MTEGADKQDRSRQHFTLTDIDVGARLVEALVRHAVAEGGVSIAHADLLTLGRKLHPRDATLGRAVPIGIGMKLRFVSAFCTAHGYPDLARLADGRAPDADREALAAWDWSAVPVRLEAFVRDMRAKVPMRWKPRKERPADVAWYAYFCSHRDACAKLTAEDKQDIINLLMAGLDPETALREVMAARAEQGAEQ